MKKILILSIVFSTSVSALSLTTVYQPLDSLGAQNFGQWIGLVFNYDTINCEYNNNDYKAIVKHNNNIISNKMYEDILTDTLIIIINNKEKRLWYFKYKDINESSLIFRSNGFWRGKLVIPSKFIKGFLAFPRSY